MPRPVSPPGADWDGSGRLTGFAEMSPEYQAELEKCLKTFPAPKK